MPMNAAQARAAGVYRPDPVKVRKFADGIRAGKLKDGDLVAIGLPQAFFDAVTQELQRRPK